MEGVMKLGTGLLFFGMMAIACVAALPGMMTNTQVEQAFTWDLQTRDHGEVKHADDAPLLDECKQDPSAKIFYVVTKYDPRGVPVKYNRICLRFTPEGIITIFEVFLRNGGTFERITFYHQDQLKTYEQLMSWMAKRGFEMVTETQFFDMLGAQ